MGGLVWWWWYQRWRDWMEDAADGPQNVEYVSEQLDVKDPSLEAFSNVFARFQLPPETTTVCGHPCNYTPLVCLTASTGSRWRAHERRGYLFRRRHGLRGRL